AGPSHHHHHDPRPHADDLGHERGSHRPQHPVRRTLDPMVAAARDGHRLRPDLRHRADPDRHTLRAHAARQLHKQAGPPPRPQGGPRPAGTASAAAEGGRVASSTRKKEAGNRGSLRFPHGPSGDFAAGQPAVVRTVCCAMAAILNVVLPIFAIMAAGYFRGRAGILGQDSSRALNGFVYYAALPALFFGSLADTPLTSILLWDFIAVYGLGLLLVLVPSALLLRAISGSRLEISAMHGMSAI